MISQPGFFCQTATRSGNRNSNQKRQPEAAKCRGKKKTLNQQLKYKTCSKTTRLKLHHFAANNKLFSLHKTANKTVTLRVFSMSYRIAANTLKRRRIN